MALSPVTGLVTELLPKKTVTPKAVTKKNGYTPVTGSVTAMKPDKHWICNRVTKI
jgi:hypothetical protein